MRRTLVAGLIGGGYGLVISLLVNIALVAIAKNKIFATYFGILFSLLGSGFLWRICKSPVTVTGGSSIHRPLLITFAILVLIAGQYATIPSISPLNKSTTLNAPRRRLLLHRRRQHPPPLRWPQNTRLHPPRHHRMLRAHVHIPRPYQRLHRPRLSRTVTAKVMTRPYLLNP